MAASERKKKRVTLLDVARHAQVSRATASLVIRKSPLVGALTRERVENSLQELGYIYNMGAASLRGERSRTIGVIVPTLSNPFFGELLSGIDNVVNIAGIVVILAVSGEKYSRQNTQLQRMREQGVDGVIISLTGETEPTLIEQIADWGLPVVQMLRHVSDKLDYAGIDYAGGMEQAVKYLASLGHRDIALIVHGPVHYAYRERVEGFRNTMTELCLNPELIIRFPMAIPDIVQSVPSLFTQNRCPTAAICFNDLIALGVCAGLQDVGRQVGTDFSLIGFDDVSNAESTRPRLTSVATFPVSVGQNAAQLLLQRIADPKNAPRNIISDTKLKIRQSCGPFNFTSSLTENIN